MKRILIVANTYYQLLLSMQLKRTLFEYDYVTLMLSNHSQNARTFFERLHELNFFDETVFVESKGELQNRGKLEKFIEIIQLSSGGKNKFSFYLKDIKDLKYDEYISYNLEIDTYALFAILSEYNKELKYSSYEEGVLSYGAFYYDSNKFKLIRKIRKIKGKPAIFDKYDTFYCMYPEVYEGTLKTVKIPAISLEDRKLIDAVRYTFDVRSEVDYSRYKCIYFESIYETEGRSIDERKIIMQLAEEIGRENILIKKHPRSKVDIYEKLGMNVDINSSVPFEAIQLNTDLSKCVFLCAISGSVLSTNAIVQKPSKTVMFYPLTSYKRNVELTKFMSHSEETIKKLQATGAFDYIKVVESMEELLCEFKEL